MSDQSLQPGGPLGGVGALGAIRWMLEQFQSSSKQFKAVQLRSTAWRRQVLRYEAKDRYRAKAGKTVSSVCPRLMSNPICRWRRTLRDLHVPFDPSRRVHDVVRVLEPLRRNRNDHRPGSQDVAVGRTKAGPHTQVSARHRESDGADRRLRGIAASASEGRVGGADLRLRPIARDGELLETVPGMIVTQHSGEGKANQYFVRGFNLDHGTDFQTRLEGMPLNLPRTGTVKATLI